MKPLFLGTLTVLLLASALHAGDSQYIGAERCRTCHEKEYRIWSQLKHASAQKILPASKQGELQCLFCHATDARKKLVRYRLANIQCEACHGPGRQHAKLAQETTSGKKIGLGGLSEITSNTCTQCHSATRSPTIKPFNYPQALEAIRHW